MKPKKGKRWTGNRFNRKVERFERQVETLRKRLGSGDENPISVVIIDRRRHEHFGYDPVPTPEYHTEREYDKIKARPSQREAMARETEDALLLNLGTAHDALEHYMDAKRHREDKEKLNSLPIGEKVKVLCRLCRLGVGFQARVGGSTPSTEFLSKHPDYPPIFHVGSKLGNLEGERCDSFEARRQHYNRENDQDNPDESQWCPLCLAWLRECNSFKDSGDKGTCQNPVCEGYVKRPERKY